MTFRFLANQMSYVKKFRGWVAQLNLFKDENGESPDLFDRQRLSTRIFLILIASTDTFENIFMSNID